MVREAPPVGAQQQEPRPLAHPNWAKPLWSQPKACKFHIVTSRYTRTRRWRKYADILVEVVDAPADAAAGEAYLFPSAAARPAMRDAEHLATPVGRELLNRKKAASEEFIERHRHRLLDGACFDIPGRGGRTEVGVYCAGYDAFLNESMLSDPAGAPSA